MHNIKEFLKGIRRAEILIERKREQLERLEHLAIYQGVRYGDEPRGSSSITDKRAEIVCSAIMLKEEIESDIDELIDMKTKAMKMIDSLGNAEAVDVLYLRYFEHMKWEDIARRKGYSLDWVYRTHRDALRRLSENNVN